MHRKLATCTHCSTDVMAFEALCIVYKMNDLRHGFWSAREKSLWSTSSVSVKCITHIVLRARTFIRACQVTIRHWVSVFFEGTSLQRSNRVVLFPRWPTTSRVLLRGTLINIPGWKHKQERILWKLFSPVRFPLLGPCIYYSYWSTFCTLIPWCGTQANI